MGFAGCGGAAPNWGSFFCFFSRKKKRVLALAERVRG
jgi:hypothetical protein